MRRKRTSQAQICNTDEHIRISIMDLPTEVIVEILLKIPSKSVISCKCVCKSWRVLISNPHFVKAHSAQANASLFVCYLKNLYLMERPEDEFEDDRATLPLNPDTKLKIPLRSTHVVLNDSQDHDDRPNMCNLRPEKPSYCILNSCNGLVCLAGPLFEPVAVCNPITGEFLTLPRPYVSSVHRKNYVVSRFSGLGFSPKHNQYKVFRTFARIEEGSGRGCFARGGIFGEIFTLEKGSSWRGVGSAPDSSQQLYTTTLSIYSPTYIRGALHWLSSMNSIA
ncbi:hypothetical protein TIFTF001_002037 [Ficus carica]|uniref:F-box domain-containing protein n=1 Tax=Ficus carica TaxID=3494 RepID=A0AA87ZRH8_FICCA|nr:hypothetical protein TIFTF001_002037 [Ficus carica]